MAETVLSGGIQVIDIPNGVSVAFDVDALDELIRAHGVRFIHWRAMSNPVGMVDRYGSRRPDEDHSGSSNGLLYTRGGCLTAIFTGNTKEIRAQTSGVLDAGIAQITPARFYSDSGEPAILFNQDRLFLEEESIMVTHQQLVDSHAAGRDRLQFPACKVQDLVDAANIRYEPGRDFDLVDGDIVWRPDGSRPTFDASSGRGRVYGIRYLYRPHWYVDRLIHETRVAQTEDMLGNRKLARLPQAAVVQREYVYLNEKNDPNAPRGGRQTQVPEDGSMGPR